MIAVRLHYSWQPITPIPLCGRCWSLGYFLIQLVLLQWGFLSYKDAGRSRIIDHTLLQTRQYLRCLWDKDEERALGVTPGWFDRYPRRCARSILRESTRRSAKQGRKQFAVSSNKPSHIHRRASGAIPPQNHLTCSGFTHSTNRGSDNGQGTP